MKIDADDTMRLTPQMAGQIAKLHELAFKNFFLTSLGNSFLVGFYNAVLSSPTGFGVGVFQKDKLATFAVGTTQTSGFYKNIMTRNGIDLLFRALPALVKNPTGIKRLVSNLIGGGSTETFHPATGGWLLSICTDPDFAGNGCSQRCLRSFERMATENNVATLWLTTDAENNERANRFYTNQQYTLHSVQQNASNRSMNLYYKTLQ